MYVGGLALNNNNTALSALTTAAVEINLLYFIKDTAFGPFVHTINGYIPSGDSGWLYAVNGQMPSVGASNYTLSPGDYVQWFYGGPNTQPY